MATIPIRREQVAVPAAVGLNRIEGQEIRAKSREDLLRTSGKIQIARASVNFGVQATGIISQIASAEFNKDLAAFSQDQLQEIEQSGKSQTPEQLKQRQADYQAFIAERTDSNPFISEQSKISAQTQMANDFRAIAGRNFAFQQAESKAAFESERIRLGQDRQSLDPVTAGLAGLQFDLLVDEEVEAGRMAEDVGVKLKHKEKFTAERAMAMRLPAKAFFEGISDGGGLVESGTPDDRRKITEQYTAQILRDLSRANTAETAAGKAAEKAKDARDNAYMGQMELKSLRGELGIEDAERAVALGMDAKDVRLIGGDIKSVGSPEDDPVFTQLIDDLIDARLIDDAKTAIATAVEQGGLTTDTARSYRSLVRRVAEDLSPAAARGLKHVRGALQPPPGARSEAFIYRESQLIASLDFLRQIEANPGMPPRDVDALAAQLVQRFQAFDTSGIAQANGLAPEIIEANPKANQSNVTMEDTNSATRLLNQKLRDGLIDRDTYLKRLRNVEVWQEDINRRNPVEANSGNAK